MGRPNCSCSCRLGGLAQEEEEKRREEVEKRRGAGSVCSLAGSPSGEPKRKKRNRLFFAGPGIALVCALQAPRSSRILSRWDKFECALPPESRKRTKWRQRGRIGNGKKKACAAATARVALFSRSSAAPLHSSKLFLFSLCSLSLSPKETHNVRQQGPEEAHEDDLDDGQEGLLEKRGRERELKKGEVSANSSEQAN